MSHNITEIIAHQREFFATKKTFDINYRLTMLRKLKETISAHEADICDALKADLGKSRTEGYMSEIGITLSELSYQIKHLRSYAKPRRRPTGLANFHAKSFVMKEPYGCVLIMSPWNYPFMLTLDPLVGAIAAGNVCVVKPSAYSPATSAIIARIIREVFPPEYITVVEGGRAENTELLNQRFDYIFFTGGVTVGKLVMEKASAHLTPVTLELGGKSPCIIDADCNLRLTAKRLAFGKFLNCGQTCVAPDYVLIDRRIKDDFLPILKEEITKMYGEDPFANPDYGKIINQKHFDRICGLIPEVKPLSADMSKAETVKDDTSKAETVKGGTSKAETVKGGTSKAETVSSDMNKTNTTGTAAVIYGGTCRPDTLQIAPTILDHVTADDAVMQEEIFGPVLPILTYDSLDEAEAFIKAREKPLALYIFTKNRDVEQRFLRYVSFGGGCVNDTIMHLATSEMGFGGVGGSGMGSYHGRKSFETFSHEKSILKKYCWIDMPMRYQPYKEIYDKIIRIFLH